MKTARHSPDPRGTPHIIAVKRWTWAGWYARWDWRYLVNQGRRLHTPPMLMRRYAQRLGHTAVCRLMDTAQAAYQEPGGVPVGIFMGPAVLVPSEGPETAADSRRTSP